jgi:hypothetical protein
VLSILDILPGVTVPAHEQHAEEVLNEMLGMLFPPD